jgi:O-acetyl-ADP-ribose deacetylase (regulator of RNase III)
MGVSFKSGDMFAERVDALVNTVNCVGVMGKGVALEFKQRWPENFKVYKAACDAKTLVPGRILIYENRGLFGSEGPRFLVNFPTKSHWRSPSKISYIEDGLDSLVEKIRLFKIKSIALPPLGCGNGGLDWSDVKPIIAEKLSSLSDVDIIVFSPWENVDEPEFAARAALTMNRARATLLKTLSELELRFDGAFDRLSLQKIVYFLQVLGVEFKLGFQRNLYGPYSEPLKKAFGALERHGMISGFFDGDKRAHVSPAGCAAADDFLIEHSVNIDSTIEKLARLIEGYESPYGMELLSSVHWLADKEKHYPVEKVIEALHVWSDHKNSFDDASIRSAYDRLTLDGLIN